MKEEEEVEVEEDERESVCVCVCVCVCGRDEGRKGSIYLNELWREKIRIHRSSDWCAFLYSIFLSLIVSYES